MSIEGWRKMEFMCGSGRLPATLTRKTAGKGISNSGSSLDSRKVLFFVLNIKKKGGAQLEKLTL
jgi:hypothetical protein